MSNVVAKSVGASFAGLGGSTRLVAFSMGGSFGASTLVASSADINEARARFANSLHGRFGSTIKTRYADGVHARFQ